MVSKVPHNVLTLSEMTRRPNKISAEVIDVDDLVLTEDVIKKLRASSSMSNKSTYIQLSHDGVRYNVESVNRQKSGAYLISLISTFAIATVYGEENSTVKFVKSYAL